VGLIKTVRASDSPYLKAVTLYRCDEPADDLAVPDESWDLVVMKHEGRVSVLLTGQTTRAVPLTFSPGDEFLTLSFRASSFLRVRSAEELLDQGQILPVFASRDFRLGADSIEIPHFDNADDLAARLAKLGILESDDLVEGVLSGRPLAASERSVQRHFQRTTGMTSHAFYQIRRAHDAVSRLTAGTSAADAALDAGYSDQPHMIRSLKRILGQTPTEILKGRPPLVQ
jgi:AraC-like DNA-binding protein